MVGQKREPLPVPAPHPSGTRPSTQHKEQTPWQTPAPETSDLGVQWGHSGDNKEMPTGTFGAEATEQPQPSPQSSSRGSQKSAPHTQAPWLAGASPRHKLSTLEAKESFALCARSSKPHGKSAGQRWGTGHLGAVIPVGAGRGGGGRLAPPTVRPRQRRELAATWLMPLPSMCRGVKYQGRPFPFGKGHQGVKLYPEPVACWRAAQDFLPDAAVPRALLVNAWTIK